MRTVLENLQSEWSATRRFAPPAGREPGFVRALLWLILAAALLTRCLFAYGGLPYLHSWDEPFIVSKALDMMKNGTFDPGYFVYGTLPTYASMLVSVLHYFVLMGRPATNPPFLPHIDRITTYYDTGWFWEISHPSFYLWSRWAAALAGVATILLAYLIARRMAGRWAGLLAAGLLAFQAFHVAQSSIATVDNPMTFFVMLAAWAALASLEGRRPALWYLSLASCGLAASCKYTAAASVVMPVMALVLTRGKAAGGALRWPAWASVPVVPALAFLAGTPFALFNLRVFLIDLGKAIRVYEAAPLAQSTVSPGLDHLLLQGGRMLDSLGYVAVALALIGAVLMASRRPGWILISYAVAHALLMSTSVLGYHRNFLAIYPVAAVAFGSGAVLALGWLRQAAGGRHGRVRHLPALAAVALVGLLGWNAASSLRAGVREAGTPETRGEAAGLIRAVLARDPETRVAIPTEVRMHPDDLRGLEGAVRSGNYADMLCGREAFTHYLVPVRWSAYEERNRRTAELYARLQPSAIASREWTAGVAPLLIDAMSRDPLLELLGSSGSAPDPACEADLDPALLDMSEPWTVKENGEVILIRNGYVETGPVRLAPGHHQVAVRARGTKDEGEYAKLRITVMGREGEGPGRELARVEMELGKQPADQGVAFEMDGEGSVTVRVAFINDSWDPETRRGRDAYLSRIRIFDVSASHFPEI